jgi:hypothetical protein
MTKGKKAWEVLVGTRLYHTVEEPKVNSVLYKVKEMEGRVTDLPPISEIKEVLEIVLGPLRYQTNMGLATQKKFRTIKRGRSLLSKLKDQQEYIKELEWRIRKLEENETPS